VTGVSPTPEFPLGNAFLLIPNRLQFPLPVAF
jgi:hypothetical protein